jgi:hypothetical protein
VDCEHARELIDRRLDEALSEAETCELGRHLAACRECSSRAQECEALARDLAGLPRPEIGEAAWDQRVGRAVAEGAGRLRDRRDRRAIRRLAWATAAVWFAAWLLGSLVTPRASRAAPPPVVPAIAEVGAPDVDATADEPYGGFHARLGAAMRAASTHDVLRVIPRSAVIERILAGEGLPDRPDADEGSPAAAAPRSLDQSFGAEERSHV